MSSLCYYLTFHGLLASPGSYHHAIRHPACPQPQPVFLTSPPCLTWAGRLNSSPGRQRAIFWACLALSGPRSAHWLFPLPTTPFPGPLSGTTPLPLRRTFQVASFLWRSLLPHLLSQPPASNSSGLMGDCQHLVSKSGHSAPPYALKSGVYPHCNASLTARQRPRV